MADNIWLTTSSLHFMERPQFLRPGIQLLLNTGPLNTFMPDRVFSESDLQLSE